MNFGRLIACGILAASVSAHADENFATLDVDGNHYRQVTVTVVTPTDIYFTYPGGIRNVKLEDLSPDLQQHFHYDPAKAKNAEQAQVLASAKYFQSIANVPSDVINPPAANDSDDSLLGLLPKLPSRLMPRIYLDGFMIFSFVFFLTNIASYMSGRRRGRARQRMEQRLDALTLVDLSDAGMRQIASGSKRF